jgi:DnaJ domain
LEKLKNSSNAAQREAFRIVEEDYPNWLELAQEQITEIENETSTSNSKSTALDLKHCYQTLGLKKGASPKEIKKAYRKSVLENSSDKLRQKLGRKPTEKEIKAADEKMKKINKAYEVLSNEKLRKKYDLGETDSIFKSTPPSYDEKYCSAQQFIDENYLPAERATIKVLEINYSENTNGKILTGSLDLKDFTSLEEIYCQDNEISQITGLSPTVQVINFDNNPLLDSNFVKQWTKIN